jgi:hypothetical protein
MGTLEKRSRELKRPRVQTRSEPDSESYRKLMGGGLGEGPYAPILGDTAVAGGAVHISEARRRARLARGIEVREGEEGIRRRKS